MRVYNYVGLLFLILFVGQLKYSSAAQEQPVFFDTLNLIIISEANTDYNLNKQYQNVIHIPIEHLQSRVLQGLPATFRSRVDVLNINFTYNSIPVSNKATGLSTGFSHNNVKGHLSSYERPSSELHCLALNIYFEARSESETGQRAVGHVVMNRTAHRMFPGSICEVVRQGGEQRLYRCQFSWWCDGLSDKPGNRKAWETANRIAREIYSGESNDPTGGALWYHANYVSPYWQSAFLQGPIIGRHIFYLDSDKLNS